MVIARWTTPSITYKPREVAVTDIAELRLVISQNGIDVIVKDQAQAIINDGMFIWDFAQGETSKLVLGSPASVQVDYLTNDHKRFTTRRFMANVSDSAINEVI